jgi:hypothetical protein
MGNFAGSVSGASSENWSAPTGVAAQGQGIDEGRDGLRVPSGLTGVAIGGSHVRVGEKRHDRDEPEERGGRAQAHTIRVLTLRLDAEVGLHSVEGDLDLQARDEPRDDRPRTGIEVSAERGLRGKLAPWVADDHPPDGCRRAMCWGRCGTRVSEPPRPRVRCCCDTPARSC